MSTSQDYETLKRYANAVNNKVCISQADLDPRDRAMPELQNWCEAQGDIVVLNSGLILTSDPSSRSIPNCKIKLLNMGIEPRKVLPATPGLISLLLANAAESHPNTEENTPVSVQQQRLRILIKEALAVGATDIHLEVREAVVKVRFRKHGELYLHAEWLPRVGREVTSVAFNKETDTNSAHFNPTVPQTAAMPLFIEDREVRLRLASMPAHGGYDVVMRILSVGEQDTPPLATLGYRPDQLALISRAVQQPYGAILISGPTGSGKTTTLASCMHLVAEDRKIYTIEDPVEKIILNATQIPVNTEKDDRDFAALGRAALRMDPNILVLGETRDEASARVLMRAAITGHLVFSTVHTNNATTIISRLIDFGISPLLLADSNVLVCLVSQRLVPKLCLHCALPLSEVDVPREIVARWEGLMGVDVARTLKVRGSGCQYCQDTGIAGRTVVAEVIWLDETGRRYIQKSDIFGWQQHLQANGWHSFRDHALLLVKEGICDPFAIEKLLGDIDQRYYGHTFDYRQL